MMGCSESNLVHGQDISQDDTVNLPVLADQLEQIQVLNFLWSVSHSVCFESDRGFL